MDTRPQRPKRGPRGGPKRPRRPPPPDATGQQGRYFDEIAANRQAVIVRLRDDSELHGTVSAHGEETLHLALTGGGEVVLRLDQIRTIDEVS